MVYWKKQSLYMSLKSKWNMELLIMNNWKSVPEEYIHNKNLLRAIFCVDSKKHDEINIL